MIVKCAAVYRNEYRNDEIAEKPYPTYSLLFFRESQTGRIIRRVEDLTVHKDMIMELEGIINQNELDEMHIDDILEDFLMRTAEP